MSEHRLIYYLTRGSGDNISAIKQSAQAQMVLMNACSVSAIISHKLGKKIRKMTHYDYTHRMDGMENKLQNAGQHKSFYF